ncbi:hypothetical protein AVEN_95230-1 [Araneus ventricosus]|uniref:Uncharacterized protein n=1 Tax=Araneus ventricosus TaxID=182803 RepID=A0A4Y2DHT1_ARAVE|nr:hypothetical protein AVEN_95230-1 [Araneus ventricosus]
MHLRPVLIPKIPSCEVAGTSQDLSGFKTVQHRKNLKKDSKINSNTQSSNLEKISQFYRSSTRPDSPKPPKNMSRFQNFGESHPGKYLILLQGRIPNLPIQNKLLRVSQIRMAAIIPNPLFLLAQNVWCFRIG